MANSSKEMQFTGGYSSDFNDQIEKRTLRRDDLVANQGGGFTRHGSQIPARSTFGESCEKEERKSHMYHFLAMDADHNVMIPYTFDAYILPSNTNDKTDYDVIRANHRFIWEEEDSSTDSWERTLAKKYYDKLFKEYCISDLSRYQENKFAMRWRIEKEVVVGKGQFSCGNKICNENHKLQSWEVNFGYKEHGVKKNALVKLRLCPECSKKLNFHQMRKAAGKKLKHDEGASRKRKNKSKKENKKKRKKKKKKHRRRNSDSSSGENSSESESDSDASNSDAETKIAEKSGEIKKSELDDQSHAVWSQPVEELVEKSRYVLH
eukprot:gene5380-6051_t